MIKLVRTTIAWGALGGLSIITACVANAQAPQPGPHPSLEIRAFAPTGCAAPMPQGFDWPADPVSLYKMSGGRTSGSQPINGAIDVPAQRKHGWKLFAGVTQPSSTDSSALPVFHTWYSVEEAFNATAGKVDCATRKPLLQLSLPTQLVMELDNPIKDALRKEGFIPLPRFDPNPGQLQSVTGAPVASAHDGVVAFSHVAFNQEMYDFIRDNKYYSKSALSQLIDPSKARLPIVDPPIKGISLKFSWWPAAPDRFTAVPVWDNDPRYPGDAKNPPETWKRVVVVNPADPSQPPPSSISLGGFDHPNPAVARLDNFYAVRVNAEEAAAANADFRIQKAAQTVLGRNLQEGDYLLMTAMHIATREFDPWVFVTFWWTDKPNVGPLASDMPNDVTGVWRNYVMDVSYNINAPKTGDGQAPIAFSPWLELFQLGGTRSQCMACHARAAYGNGVSAAFNPPTMSTTDPDGFDASPTGPNDSAFKAGTLSLHRVWTILTRAQ